MVVTVEAAMVEAAMVGVAMVGVGGVGETGRCGAYGARVIADDPGDVAAVSPSRVGLAAYVFVGRRECVRVCPWWAGVSSIVCMPRHALCVRSKRPAVHKHRKCGAVYALAYMNRQMSADLIILPRFPSGCVCGVIHNRAECLKR